MKGNDNMSDSDEDQHDAYLERMKEEGKIREEANDSDDSEGESGECSSLSQSVSKLNMILCLDGRCRHNKSGRNLSICRDFRLHVSQLRSCHFIMLHAHISCVFKPCYFKCNKYIKWCNKTQKKLNSTQFL